jgi:hypothetical protein
MTQRIFDIENEKDMQDLWDILPVGIIRIRNNETQNTFWSELFFQDIPSGFIKINWHDKTEITRPIQEAIEADTGKLCKFWNSEEDFYIGELCRIRDTDTGKHYEMGAPVAGNLRFTHCRRLTKMEVSELC